MKAFVLDEADEFFMDQQREDEVFAFHEALQKLDHQVQYIFFSATYDPTISEKISNLVKEAVQINLKKEKLKLENLR